MNTLKEFLSQEFYQNTLDQWAISLAIILGAIVVAKILYWAIGKFVKRAAANTKTKLDDILVDKLEEPVVYLVGIIGFYWAVTRLTLGHFEMEEVELLKNGQVVMDANGDPVKVLEYVLNEAGEKINKTANFISNTFTIVFVLNITWLIVRTVDALILEYVVPLVEKSESDLDDQLMPTIRKVFKFILWTMGTIIGLNNAGFDVMALVAGLGIGGLAFALAAQDTVKNIFGGVMVFIDKPFKPQERIVVNGIDGTVEEVGIRSTRIRTLEGRLVTVPNGTFSDNAVENVTVEPSRKIVLNLGLTYETEPDKMEAAMQYLREIVNNHEGTEEDVLISFNTWGDFSMGILLIYYIKKESDILQTQTDINMAILRKFNSEGLEFAYPTQTLYKK